MLLNRVEYALMNNPVRAALQRHVEARRLLALGGPMRGGTALELGCGRGIGAGLILDLFGARAVHAFDLDPRMVALARRRHRHQPAVRLWAGDAAAIPVADETYDAVFDFGILHHLPDWRAGLREVRRVLKPNGRFYAEEVLRAFILHPVVRRTLRHPEDDRFDQHEFQEGMQAAGLAPLAVQTIGSGFAWFIAERQS